MRPVLMPPNRLAHFYLGGEAITRLRQVPAPAERSPEEWLASTTTRHGEELVGLSHLPDGRLLRDAVRADPAAWLGPTPMPGGPGDVGVLVKLLDAGQRLPVHVHPDRGFAGAHLGSCYGKTEAWYVLDAAPDATLHLGWREDVDPADLRRAVDEQDTDWLLGRTNPLPARPGDVVLVPAGTAHAIGVGVFVVEVQEPSDFSLLLEWQGFGEAEDAFLGLQTEQALGLVRLGATGPDELAQLVRHVEPGTRHPGPERLLPPAADPFFRADLLAPVHGGPVAVEAGFGVLVVVAGDGVLSCAAGDVPVASGDVLALPHAAGTWTLGGDVDAVLCRPPTGAPG